MNFSSTRFFKRFALDHRGSLTIQFAFIMIPMIAFSGIAIDYSKAMGIKKQLQDIADSTVIAGARLPATTSQKRLDEAHHLLAAALANTSLEDVKTNIQATNANVRIEASYNYKTSLMGILGVENMQIAVKSAAQSQVENGGVACLIALNETIDDGLHEDPELLEFLRAERIPITAFLTTGTIVNWPYWTALEPVASIQNHSVTHTALPTLANPDGEICDANEAIVEQTGQVPWMMRPPYGAYNATTLAAAGRCGLDYVVHWSVSLPGKRLALVAGLDVGKRRNGKPRGVERL